MKGWKTEYEDDNFTISALRQSTYYNVRLNLDSDTTFGNLTLSGGGNLTYPIVDAQNHNVSIKRDLILSSDTNYGIHYNSFSIINADTITVGNDIKNIGRSYHINANRIIVNGNITNAEDGTHYIDYIIVRLPIPLRKIPMRSSKGIFPATYFLFIRQLRIPMSKLAA
ncbi:MAG: hypothetical protein DBX55_07695 [Verrucomicrobia bacterium]|nr:MAG: hypothetical protein DBX55_07695 [Verrucomicrobiota bacterium]